MTPDELHERLRAQRDLFNEEHSTRLHRAISWWRAAQEQNRTDRKKKDGKERKKD